MSKCCMVAIMLVLIGASVSFAFEPTGMTSAYAGDRFAAPPPSGLRFSGFYAPTPQVLTGANMGAPTTNDGFPGLGGPAPSGSYYGGNNGGYSGGYGGGNGCKTCGNGNGSCGGGTCGPGVGPCVHWSFLPWVSPSWGGHEGLRYVDVTNYWY